MKKDDKQNVCKPSLQEEVAMMKRTIAGYKGQVKSLQNRIAELRNEIDGNKMNISSFKRTIEDKDVHIDALQKRLEIMEHQNASMLSELNESNAMRTTYEAEITRYRSLPWYRKIFD